MKGIKYEHVLEGREETGCSSFSGRSRGIYDSLLREEAGRDTKPDCRRRKGRKGCESVRLYGKIKTRGR